MTTPTNPPTERLTPEQVREIREQHPASMHATDLDFRTPAKIIRCLLAHITTLESDIAQHKKWQMDVEEREAACCPEDTPFDEYVRRLEAELQEAREQIARLRKHSEWQASYGDVHPGDKQFNAEGEE